MSKPPDREQVFAVLRIDADAPAEHAVTVKEIVRDLATAEAEVARLTKINPPPSTRYSWQATRLYRAGHAAGQHPGGATTELGYINRNGQRVVRETGLPGNDHNQVIYVLACGNCHSEYGANGSDIFQRLCPKCQAGAEGLSF